MNRKTLNSRRQPTPLELRDSILTLIRVKFYQDQPPATFFKNSRHLLSWVGLWPATWLDSRAVTLPIDRYREILAKILVDAAANIRATKVTYLPAYLRQVVQSHFRIHGETYYDEAKAIRNQVEHALLVAGQARSTAPDPVRELAQAAALLKPAKRTPKAPVKDQLTLL
jgi:hypothetical protein